MEKNKNTITQAAFTLIEVLVVLAILSVMSSVMLFDYSTGRVTQELEGTAREVASAFREAQNYALTGYQGVAGTNPCRFVVSWGTTSYTTTYWYKDGSGACTQSAILGSYTLGSGTAFAGTGNFYFTLPHAAVSFATASQPVVVSKAGTSYVVCTYQSGLINHFSGTTCP